MPARLSADEQVGALPALEIKGRGEALSVPGPTVPEQDLLPLPAYVARLADGLHVALPAFESPALFRSFIDRVFGAGLRFTDLDHACLQKLLYELEPADVVKVTQDLQRAGKPLTMRLATNIVPFPSERVQCYHEPKVIEGGHAADYLFEPVMIENAMEEPVYGEPGQDGNAAIIDHLIRTVSTPAILDTDEFIAAMWAKEIRYGLDIKAISKALAEPTSERVTIARMKPPSPGQNASIVELTKRLHRDDAPKMLADGRIDLHQHQNHFPQVPKDTRLIRKIPRASGKPGWDIHGHELIAEMPRDIDIAGLAGLGTRVECTADGEFVIADMSGFLQIDTASGRVSITDKIINRDGVSLRTTGNLNLTADEYEEHGEVEELTQIEGRNMSFMANVFGNIVSHGGRVHFKKNLTAGTVRSPGGTISVEGQTSRATLEAIGGEITLQHAEGCLIVGKKVTIGTAVHCDILAEELIVETSEGSALAAQRLQVGTAMARRDVETIISMLVPDLSAFARLLDDLKHKQADFQQTAEIKAGEIDAIAIMHDVKNYSVLITKMRAHEIHMNAEQEANWHKLVKRVTPALRRLKSLNDEVHAARNACQDIVDRIQRVTHDCETMSAGIDCRVVAMQGETVIRTLKVRLDEPSLQTLHPRELRARLRESGGDNEIMFNGSEGEFEWAFQKIDPPAGGQAS